MNTFMSFELETVSIIFAGNIVMNAEGNGVMSLLSIIIFAQFIASEMLHWDVVIVLGVEATE